MCVHQERKETILYVVRPLVAASAYLTTCEGDRPPLLKS